jgi:3',5'-cyclic AMP phosphodiesterase CpdA
MRVAAIYDIHGNLPALEAVLAEIDQAAPDLIVMGGDVASGPMPKATLERLMSLGEHARFLRLSRLKSGRFLETCQLFLVPAREARPSASRRQDFWADALWHGEYPCFGAGSAPHSRVGWWPLLLPASTSPHAPRWPGQEREGRSGD